MFCETLPEPAKPPYPTKGDAIRWVAQYEGQPEAEFEDLPLDILEAMYPRIVSFGPNGNQVNDLITGLASQALQRKFTPEFDGFLNSLIWPVDISIPTIVTAASGEASLVQRLVWVSSKISNLTIEMHTKAMRKREKIHLTSSYANAVLLVACKSAHQNEDTDSIEVLSQSIQKFMKSSSFSADGAGPLMRVLNDQIFKS